MYLVKQAIELNNELLNLYLMGYNHMLRIVTHGLREEINYSNELNNFSESLTLSSEQQKNSLWVESHKKLKFFLHQKTNINQRKIFIEFIDNFHSKTEEYKSKLSNEVSDNNEIAYNLIICFTNELTVYIDTLKNLLVKKGSENEILNCIDTFLKKNDSMIGLLKKAKFCDTWSLNIVQKNIEGLVRVDDNLDRLHLKQHYQRSDFIPIDALEALEQANLLQYAYLFNIECKSGLTGSDYLNIINYFEILEHYIEENPTNIYQSIASSSNQNFTVKTIFDLYNLNKPIGGFNIAPNLLNSKNLIFIDVFNYENILSYQYNYYSEQKLLRTHKWACDILGLNCDFNTLISQYPHKFKQPTNLLEHVFSNNLSETLNIFQNNIKEIQSFGTNRLIENNPVLDKENNFNGCILKANCIDGWSKSIDNES